MKMDDIMKRHRWATDPEAYSRHVRCLRARRASTADSWLCFVALQIAAVCLGISLAAYVGVLV